MRYVELSIPSRGDLTGGAISPTESMRAFWEALAAPASVLLDLVAPLRSAVADAADASGITELTITDAFGGRLCFPVMSRAPHINVGRLHAEDLAQGRSSEEFPAGSIAWLPVDRAAHGRIRAPSLAAHGRRWSNLDLVVEGGMVVRVEGEGASALEALLQSASGDARALAEVRVGVNPVGAAETGKASLDAVMAGTVTLALGSNEVAGGAQRASVDLRFPSRVWTLEVDGRRLAGPGAG